MTISHLQDTRIQHEDRAIFSQLIALNAIFESARVGIPAQGFGTNAQSCNALLTTFLNEIKATPRPF